MKKRTWMCVAGLCLAVLGAAGLLLSGAQLDKLWLGYSEAQAEYDGLRAVYITQSSSADDATALPLVDVAALRQQNPDCVGWIEIPDTRISYPILQGATNDTYLRTTFEHHALSAGSIFMDTRCGSGFTGFNTIVFGHNMKVGSMFSQLTSYLSGSFRFEHSEIYIYTPQERMTYRVVTARETDIGDCAYAVLAADDEAAEQFLRGLHTSGTNPYTTENRYLTLSTCTGDWKNGTRLLVIAVLTGAEAY